MTGKLKDIIITRTGEQIISFSTRSDFTEEFDELKDVDIDVEIKKHREKRSLDANAYCWILIDKAFGKAGRAERRHLSGSNTTHRRSV
jgi:hypothetical protein